MDATVLWLRQNAAWLQGVLVAGIALATDFGLTLTQAQESDIIAFTAILLGAGAHVANRGVSDAPPKHPFDAGAPTPPPDPNYKPGAAP